MDVPTLSVFLRPILTVSEVGNTRETGDIHSGHGHVSGSRKDPVVRSQYSGDLKSGQV